jgi:hypothetical protein
MSKRNATATLPTPRSTTYGAVLQLHRKAPKTFGFAVLLAAALTANIAAAAPVKHYRQFRASMPESGRAPHYAPAYASRHAREVSAPVQVEPLSERGIFQQTIPAP